MNVDRFFDGYLTPLIDAVQDHTPPLHQYLNEDDEPVINFNVATIKGREGMEVVEERSAGGDDVEQDDFLRGDGDVDEDDVSCEVKGSNFSH